MRRFGVQVALVPHAFELRPDPIPLPDPDGEYIQTHWRERVYPMAAERGLIMHVPPTPTRSRLALELAKCADAHGLFAPVNLAIYRAVFEHGQNIGDLDVLVAIGDAAGLDPTFVRAALASRRYEQDVDRDLALGEALGVRSVPTMLVGETFEDAEPVIGAVPPEWLEGAIDRALRGDRSHARLRRRFTPQFRVIE